MATTRRPCQVPLVRLVPHSAQLLRDECSRSSLHSWKLCFIHHHRPASPRSPRIVPRRNQMTLSKSQRQRNPVRREQPSPHQRINDSRNNNPNLPTRPPSSHRYPAPRSRWPRQERQKKKARVQSLAPCKNGQRTALYAR